MKLREISCKRLLAINANVRRHARRRFREGNLTPTQYENALRPAVAAQRWLTVKA